MAQDSNNKKFTVQGRLVSDNPKGGNEPLPSEVSGANGSATEKPAFAVRVDEENPNWDAQRARRTMDSVGSEGYQPERRAVAPSYSTSANPNQRGISRGGSSLPSKNNLSNSGGNNQGLHSDNDRGLSGGNSRGIESTPAPRRNESAPDIGKDYGSSEPPAGPANAGRSAGGTAVPDASSPAYNGYGANGGAGVPPVAGGDIGDHPSNVDNDLPKDNNLGDQSEAQQHEQEQAAQGAKNGANGLENGEGGQKPGEQGKPGEKPGEKPANPEAKGGKNAPIAEEQAGKPQPNQPAGNGYGALRNRNRQQGQNQGPENGDVTKNARRNADRSQRMANDKAQERGRWPKGKASTGSINTPVTPSLGQRARNFMKNRLTGGKNKGGERDTEHNANIGGTGFSSQWGATAKNWLLAHPLALMALIVGGIVLLIILAGDAVNTNGNNSSSGAHCTYNLNGVTSTGSVNLDSIQVELINCDGKKDNYKVIETVDFEKYVIGVAWAETQWHSDAPAYFQAQVVAARGFALTRQKGMCPSNPDNCFYGYNASTGKIRLRNCSNDQNYCDPDKACYRKERDGQKALTGLEAEQEGPTRVWYPKPSDETKAAFMAAAAEVKGKVLVDSSGNVVYTNYVNTDQNHWYELAKQGKNYEEILKEHYAGSNASGMNSAVCTTAGNIDYGDYVLSSDGHEILHEPLDQFLQSKGTSLEEFNSLIASNVDKAGYGTRAGVVAAAVTLIGELGNKYSVKVPYFWGGGHADGVVDGALGKWGSSQCHTYANNQSYDYCGLDCSGFVPWAIKNGGFNIAQMLASNFQYMDGAERVSLSSSSAVLQPGDLLESEHHIVLVIGIEESSGNYICAEASGNAQGVLFTRRPFSGGSGYWGVKMDGFYNTRARSK